MGLEEWGEGLKKYKLVVDGHEDGEHGIGNAVSINILAGWKIR